MKNLFLFIAFIFCYTSGNAQTFNWAKNIGGAAYDHVSSTATDAQGNLIISGAFEGTVDFDPGVSVYNLTAINADDYFILKLDSSGNFLWAVSIEGMADVNLKSKITIDASGNILMIGNYKGTVDFDPGTAVFNLSSTSTFSDVFILKLDNNGQFIWAKSFGGLGADDGKDIITDANNNIYTTGSFTGNGDFDPGNNVYTLNNNGAYDIFISKLDANGDFVWAKSIGGNYSDDGYGISLDASNNVYVAGNFLDVVDFDPGSGVYNLTAMASWDPFVLKLDSNGDFIWAKQIEGNNAEFAYAIKTTPSGDCYVTGIFNFNADFDPGTAVYNLTSTGQEDVFVLHLNSNGDFIWAKALGGSETDNVTAIDVDANLNVYTTGSFSGIADFDPANGTFSLDAGGSGTDAFISKLDSMGNFVWAKQIGSEDDNEIGLTLHCDFQNDLYIGGSFEETCDLNVDAGTDNHISNGQSDAFIIKMNDSSTPTNISIPQPFINFSVYPNPASDNLYFYTDNSYEKLIVSIFSANGTLIMRKCFKEDALINVRELSAGIYSYQIMSMQQPLNIHTGNFVVVK